MSMSMAKVEAKSLESKNSLTPNSLKMSNINANEHEHDYVDEDDADSVVIRENVRTHPATGPGATATATASAGLKSVSYRKAGIMVTLLPFCATAGGVCGRLREACLREVSSDEGCDVLGVVAGGLGEMHHRNASGG